MKAMLELLPSEREYGHGNHNHHFRRQLRRWVYLRRLRGPVMTQQSTDNPNRAAGNRAAEGADTVLHTPGPWKWQNDPYEDGVPYITITAGEILYTLNGIHITGIFSEANARLITAAPDMLAALKRLASPANFSSTLHAPGCGCCVCEARAAIAKATGGRP